MKNIVRNTKASMLAYVRRSLPDANILDMCVVRRGEYNEAPDSVVCRVDAFAGGRRLIVRSSSSMEDGAEYSNAGAFESVLNVKPDRSSIKAAIDAVYASYPTTDDDEEVLIQPMLDDVKLSGVVFTRDMETYAEYYVINYAEGGETDVVTSGSAAARTLIVHKHSAQYVKDKDLAALIDVAKEIERLLDNDALDIEFAVTTDSKPVILQVRPIAKGKKEVPDSTPLEIHLNSIHKKIKKLQTPHPFLLGRSTSFGVMPDWNPAEILGLRPKKLAVSLYKELITDSIWAAQRSGYGYRDLAMHPLMISFCGIPYIDTRITFNSFVPAKLNGRIAEKLINYYLDRLTRFPKYHDKVEFKIVYSCAFPGIHDRLRELLDNGFNENEIARIEYALLDLTNAIIDPNNGLCSKDILKAETLEANYNKIMRSDISLVDKIYWLIEECKRYGSLPFAGAARAAFVAVQLLRSFVDTGIFTEADLESYMNSLNTVSKRLTADLSRLRAGNMSREDFLAEYGHLRPGTYDITSERYDEAFDKYFGSNKGSQGTIEQSSFVLSSDKAERIQTELDENGLLATVDELFSFIKSAIEGREYVKFVFTRSLSMVLRLIGELGRRADIPYEDIAHLDVSVVKQLYSDLYAGNIKEIFERNIEANKKQYNIAQKLKLPSLIVEPNDVYAFHLLEEEPNFITQKSITAETATLSSDPCGKILFIQSADPGYDFVFSKNISCLITQFGGANSHMAIRCAELGIPAVIGVGEKNYVEWGRCSRLTVDCQKKLVIKLD